MRYLQPHVEADLGRKMVFVGGPRQCGKTTLAKQVLAQKAPGAAGLYLKWGDDRPSPALKYYVERLRPRRAVQIVGTLRRSFDSGPIQVRSAQECFASLDGLL